MTKCPRKTMIFHREFPIILTTLSKIEYRPVSNHAVLSMQNHDFKLPWRDFLSKIVLFYRKFVAIPYTLKKTKFWRNQLDIQFKQPKIIFLSRFCNIFNKKHIFDSKWQRYLINFTKLMQYLPTNWHQNTKWFTNDYQRWITIHSNRSAQGIRCAERLFQLSTIFVRYFCHFKQYFKMSATWSSRGSSRVPPLDSLDYDSPDFLFHWEKPLPKFQGLPDPVGDDLSESEDCLGPVDDDFDL